ncbi:hypothetical protein Goari_026329, partial [Gossypium aridum]|nr:hypothetical protein [Gossypium aridum]
MVSLRNCLGFDDTKNSGNPNCNKEDKKRSLLRMACKGCLECLLKLLNFLMTLVGLAMVGYGIYLFVEYKRAADVAMLLPPVGTDQIQLGRPMLMAVSLSSSIFDNLPKAWYEFFSHFFISLAMLELVELKMYSSLDISNRMVRTVSRQFIYLFIGVGVVLFVISCFGCIGASTRNLCCLSCVSYLLLRCNIVFTVGGLVDLGGAGMCCFHILRQKLERNKTGYFDMIYQFLEENWSIVKWVALGIVVLE